MRTRERFWVCDHYKVLPTDDRFRALTDLQVSALFSGWLYSLPEAELWKAYWSEKSKEKPKVNAKELLDIGYSESEIRAILKELGQ
jgi:hypothetical protein